MHSYHALRQSLFCLVNFLFQISLSAAVIHVAPAGSDQNQGTDSSPFATLQRAQIAVRNFRSATPGEAVTVLIHGGRYIMEKSLVLEPEDSGTTTAPVVFAAAPGEKPVFSGGRLIKGWRKHNAQLWVAEIPAVKAGEWNFVQLFVGGEVRPRARTPNTGFLRVAGCPEGTPKTADYHKDCQSFEFKKGDIDPNWSNLQDVEVIVYHFWTDSHLPIKSVDTVSNVVTFAHKAGKTFTDDFTEDGARYIVENVFEGLDEPGEWYSNRKEGRLYYYPKPGEDLNRIETVAPILPRFIEVKGDPGKRRFVEHVSFEGIAFEYTRFELPPGNSNDQQGSASVPAAVKMVGARNCRIENCEFRKLGTWGIELGRGCQENVFRGITVSQVAAGGIRLNGGTYNDHPFERTGGNVISDNVVEYYGQLYPSAVAVLLMNTDGNVVTHNLIHHGYYTGISIGWVWGYGRSVSQNNHIEYNHIHTIGQGLLSDMGGIYTLGVSSGTTIRNNLIHDVDANQYGGWGIYHDEGSTHLLVESNVVYRTKFGPFNIHYAKEVTVRNNIFALGRLEQLSRGRVEPHKSVFFEKNIVYWQTEDLFKGQWKDEPYSFHMSPINKGGATQLTSTFDCDWNLYFNPGFKMEEVKFADATWTEWQARGKDRKSVYADPMFVDPEKGDFRLRPASPAFALGFQPIDLSQVGPRTGAAK